MNNFNISKKMLKMPIYNVSFLIFFFFFKGFEAVFTNTRGLHKT